MVKKKLLNLLLSLFYSILNIIDFIFIYFSFALILSHVSVNSAINNTTNDVAIYILTNGVHTDIVLPIKNNTYNWSHQMKFENTAANDTLAQYVSFGWGDKGFYLETPTWADLKFSTAFKAMFYLDKTAIHSSFYRKMKEDDDCIKIKISKEQYQKMIVYVNQSFEKDKDGNVMLIKGKSYGNRDAFYEATGTYGLFNTCNTWANGGLKYCNLKACVWTTFDKGIFYQYKKK